MNYTGRVRSWVPVRGTTKGDLVHVALAEFGQRGFDAVGITELAEAAGVTIGSLYHHFGSKLGLYQVVRADVERRVLDRMEGARAVATHDLAATLTVGFDYVVEAGFARMLAERHPSPDGDPIEAFITTSTSTVGVLVGRLIAAAWRSALEASGEDPAGARNALRIVANPIST
jgi:AcrR family transcriptional regulator